MSPQNEVVVLGHIMEALEGHIPLLVTSISRHIMGALDGHISLLASSFSKKYAVYVCMLRGGA